MLISIAIHRIIIAIRPPNMDLNPKNMIVQKKFNISCTANAPIAILTSFLSKPSRHTKNSAIPIKMYRIVHIGANAHDGGVQEGLFKTLKNVVIESKVAKELANPTINGIKIEIISFGISPFLKLSIIFPPLALGNIIRYLKHFINIFYFFNYYGKIN